MINQILIIFIACLLFIVSPNLIASDNSTQDISLRDEVVAQVGSERITKADYQAYIQYRQVELKKKNVLFTPQNIQNFQKKVMAEIVEQTMIFLLATRENIICSDKELNETYQEGIQLLGGEEEYLKWLKSNQLTDEYIKEQIQKKSIVDQYIKKIETTISVSDDEIEDVYKKYVKSGWAKRALNTYDFANILIIDFVGDPEKEKQINEIYKRIQNGEDFFSLAQQFSEDSFSKMQECRYYEMNLQQVLPEVKHYLVMLPEGGVSQPFRTQNGWNIIKVLSKNMPGTIRFDKMKKGIYKQLVDRKVRLILKNKLEELQKEITIIYYQNNN